MNILFSAIVLVLACLLILWLLPSWGALSAQWGSLFLKTPPEQAGPTPAHSHQPLGNGKQPRPDAPAHAQTGRRHTVVPHQARGR